MAYSQGSARLLSGVGLPLYLFRLYMTSGSFSMGKDDDVQLLPAWRTSLRYEAQRQMLHARPLHSLVISRGEVIQRLEGMVLKLLSDVANGGRAELSFEEHHCYKSIYFDVMAKCHRPKDLTRPITISIESPKTSKSLVVMLRVLEIIHSFLICNKHTTKRDIYYMDVPLFGNQTSVDRAIENIASLLRVPRSYLNVVGAEKSVVAGHVRWKENGDQIDCLHFLNAGKPIPGDSSSITEMSIDARFLLIVEDHATFMRLLNDGFLEKFGPCVLLTGKGVPDVAARRLVRMMKDAAPSLVVLGLCDYDPWGLQILCTYAFGSLRMTYDVEGLATPELLWLGVHSDDTTEWEMPPACFAEMTEKDVRKGNLMLEMPALKAKPAWRKELAAMVAGRRKMELQALSSLSLSFLCETFLPHKLSLSSWL